LSSPRFSAIRVWRSIKRQQTHLRRGHVAAINSNQSTNH